MVDSMYIAMDMKSRKYDMGTRQQAKTATRDAIIKAAIDTFMAERSFAITLPAVAERADVTVKTVLRHFGSREALIDAAWSQAYDDVMAERTPPPDDADGGTGCAHRPLRAAGRDRARHARRGERPSRSADEQTRDGSHIATGWRRSSRAGFPRIAARSPVDRRPRRRHRRLRWKLLRLDRGLSVDDVHDRMLLMTEALLAEPIPHRRAMKILFAIVDGGGNIPPQLAVARALAVRGVADPGARSSRHP